MPQNMLSPTLIFWQAFKKLLEHNIGQVSSREDGTKPSLYPAVVLCNGRFSEGPETKPNNISNKKVDMFKRIEELMPRVGVVSFRHGNT